MTLFVITLGQEMHDERLPEELRDVPYPKAAHEIESMHFDGSDADIQVSGDLAVRQSLCDESEDFLLARRDRMR